MRKSFKKRNSKGGSIWDSISNGFKSASQSVNSGLDSLNKNATNLWNKTKKQNTYSTPTPTPSPTPTTTPTNNSNTYSTPTTNPTTYSSSESSNNYITKGGRKRRTHKKRKSRKSRNQKAGYINPPYQNVAFQAAPFHGPPTAKAHWIGGKKKQSRKRKQIFKFKF